MSIWDNFDEIINVESLKEEVKNVEKNNVNTGEFVEVPHDKYEVRIDKMFPNVSKKGDPMLTIWFTIINHDEFEGQKIFYNQPLKNSWGIHFANELMRSMGTNIEIEFTNMSSYANIIEEVFKYIQDNKLEYALDYRENKKNPKFNEYEILEVFKPEGDFAVDGEPF